MANLANSEENFQQARQILAHGGVIVHATEGVFGFACSVRSQLALEKISDLKGRDADAHPYLVLIGDVAQLEQLVSIDVPKWDLILTSWPGPNTWIFPEKSNAYDWIGGSDGSLAVRMPGHSQALELAKAAGPLVSTSANRSGRPACLSLEEAEREFSRAVDFYLPGELTNPGEPSRIVHAATGEVIRG